MNIDEMLKHGMSRVGNVYVRSALNPFLWSFCWSLAFLGFAVAFRDDPLAKYGLLLLAAVPMLVTMGIGCYFAFTTPDRLQSEEYHLRQQALQILYRKGTTAEIEKVIGGEIEALGTAEKKLPEQDP